MTDVASTDLSWMASPEPPVLVSNLFPCVVEVDGERVSAQVVRVFLTDARELAVYGFNTEAAIAPLATGVVVSLPDAVQARVGYDVQLEDGRRVVVRKEGGCGCGNPLKTFSPFTYLRSGT